MELEVALDKLEGLGSPGAIANFLEEEGIQGYRSSGTSCPVTNYLIREGVATENQLVHTSQQDVSVHTMVDVVNDDSVKVVALSDTSPIKDFVVNFDVGNYPNLTKKNN